MNASTLTSSRVAHQVASGKSLRALTEWAVELGQSEAAGGKRVLWAPAHALAGSVSLRSWILEQASQLLGDSAPEDAPTLVSGAADLIILADPASADNASLHWLTELLACSEEVADLTTTAPLPRLVVLAPNKTVGEAAVSDFLERLNQLGAEDVRVPSRGSDLAPPAVAQQVAALAGRNDLLLAALSLLPCPLRLEELNELVSATGSAKLPASELLGGELFQVADGFVVPCTADVTQALRAQATPALLKQGAELLLKLIESRMEGLPDARVELSLHAGDVKRATRLARRRFDDHFASGRYEEALRLLELTRRLGFSIETGKLAADIDEARMAVLHAELGNNDAAREIVQRLVRRREGYSNADFVEWLALAARLLAMRGAYEPRSADSLMRRAIRMAGDNLDSSVRLTLQRVSLLRSNAFRLDDRADWLLSHINQEMLEQVSKATLGQYLDESGMRLFSRGDHKGTLKRLRKLTTIATADQHLGRAMLVIAECREQVGDHEGALRYASSGLQYSLRAASLSLTQSAARLLRMLQSKRPRELPRFTPSQRLRASRGRVAAVDMPAPPVADPAQLFEIMEARFGVLRWTRRRRGKSASYGKDVEARSDALSVFEEREGGQVARVAHALGVNANVRALTLLRSDGDDVVYFSVPADAEPREDSIVRFLLADRAPAEISPASDAAPARKTIVDEYLRRAVAHGTERGLHATMEMLFNKDLLLYLEETGLTKEEMAERLNVSRATLYRMYARAGLN
ncbi:MAG: hypothetical protein IT463_06535 [Planctomycetes bacterium]|nr:hypothetical protein [Planctomycetota bacterium]